MQSHDCVLAGISWIFIKKCLRNKPVILVLTQGMDFQKLLLDVGHALSRDEKQAVAFLCTDLLGRDLSSLESISDLFSLLVDQDLLSAERPYLLADLLSGIQRHRLIRDLGLDGQRSSTRSLISPYRRVAIFFLTFNPLRCKFKLVLLEF